MNTNQDLNTAINHVATRMVAVADDPGMVTRIVAALPERSSRLGWLMPQFAALSAIAIVAVVWSTRERPTVLPVLPSSDVAAIALPPVIAAREPGTAVRTMPVEPMEPMEPMEPVDPSRSDFERALPAIEALSALTMSDLTPRELPAADALSLAPLEIGELPLTAETISPNKF